MSEKEVKKQAALQFAGQDTDEAKAAVKRQRELKKKRDALRKAEKKLKATKPDNAEYASIQQEMEELKAAITALEGGSMPASPDEASAASSSPVVPSATAPAVAAGSSSPGPKEPVAEDDEAERKKREEKELKKQSEMNFMGQDTEEAKAAVKRQRDLKKKKDALRKTQKKLKSMKPEDAAYAATKEEEAQLEKEIHELEGTSSVAPADLPSSNAAKGGSAPSAGTAGKPAKASGAVAEAEEEEDKEANAAKLRQLVERAIRESRGSLVSRARDSLVHARVAEVTIMMEEMLIVGGNARALAMIAAFRDMFRTTTILAGSSLQDTDTQAFTELVERNFAFMRRKREANAGMRYVKEAVVRRLIAVRDEIVQQKHRGSGGGGEFDGDSTSGRGQLQRQHSVLELFPGDAREVALQILDMIESEIRMSVKSIVEERSLPYISNTDTILVFGRSSVVEFMLLSRVHSPQRCPKKVIVIDSAPLYEGRELAHKLSEVGIDVTYGLITAACTLMPKCTRVFIGASSVLQNGDVFGRCGTALIAACAKAFRKPVLCFSESYKFVSEVWLGNLAQNTKLMDIKEAPATHDAAAGRSPLLYSTPPTFSPPQPQPTTGLGGFGTWGKGAGEFTPPLYASALNTAVTTPLPNASSPSSSAASGYLYDLTPAAYVDMIICEMGCLHTSAIVAAIKDREGRDASPAMVLTLKNSL